MLNDKWGAVYFWIMSLAMTLVFIFAFWSRGWLQHFTSSTDAPYQADLWLSEHREQRRGRQQGRSSRARAASLNPLRP